MPDCCWLLTNPFCSRCQFGSAEVVAYLPLVERTALRAQPVLSVSRSARATSRNDRARVASPASHVSPWCAKIDEIEEDVPKRVPRKRAPQTRAASVVDDDTDRADSDREGVETMLPQGMGRRFRREGAVKRGADGRGGGHLGARRVFCGAAWRGARPAAPSRRGVGSAAAARLGTGLAAAARRGSELAARAALQATRWRSTALSRAPASASPARSIVANGDWRAEAARRVMTVTFAVNRI
jgi:hypothetical protein